MANTNKTFSVTFKLDGVEQSVKTVNDLEKSIASLEEEMKSADFGSAKYKAAQKELVKVSSAMKQVELDTEGMDNEMKTSKIADAATGIAGAFGLAAGASALFGAEGSRAAELTAKATAALTVVMSAREVVDGLINNSLAKRFIMEKAAAVQTGLMTAATWVYNSAKGTSNALEEKSTALSLKDIIVKRASAIGTGIVTAAQWAWNAAMTANPIGLIAVAIIGVVAVITGLVIWLGKATGAFDKMGDAIRTVGHWLGLMDSVDENASKKRAERQLDAFKKNQTYRDQQVANAEGEIALMNAKGAKASEIHNKEVALLAMKIKNARTEADLMMKKAGSLKEMSEEEKKTYNDLLALQKSTANEMAVNQATYDKKIADDKKAADAEKLAKQKEYHEKVVAAQKEHDAKLKELNDKAYVDTITDEEEKAKALLEIQYNKDLESIKNTKANQDILLAMKNQYDKDYAKIESDASDKLIEEMLADSQKQIDATKVYDETMLGLTREHNLSLLTTEEEKRNQQLIWDQEDEIKNINKVLSVEEREAQIAAINQKYNDINLENKKTDAEKQKAIDEAVKQNKIDTAMAGLNLLATIGQAMQDAAGSNKKQAKAGVRLTEAAGIGQIAINTAVGASKAIAQMGPVLGGVMAAITIAGGVMAVIKTHQDANKSISAIDGAGGEGGGGSEAAAPVSSGSKFAKGGMLSGPSHANGGILSPFGELEGGEFVTNKRTSAAMFSTISKMNAIGNSNASNQDMELLNRRLDGVLSGNQSQPIIKTYVVASEMSSQQEADRKMKNLARL